MTNNTQHTDVMNALQQHGVFRFLLITKNLFLLIRKTISADKNYAAQKKNLSTTKNHVVTTKLIMPLRK